MRRAAVAQCGDLPVRRRGAWSGFAARHAFVHSRPRQHRVRAASVGAGWRPGGRSGRTLLGRGTAGAVLGGVLALPASLSLQAPECPACALKDSPAPGQGCPRPGLAQLTDHSAPTLLGAALSPVLSPDCRYLKAGLRARPKSRTPGHPRHSSWVLSADRPFSPAGAQVPLPVWIPGDPISPTWALNRSRNKIVADGDRRTAFSSSGWEA